MRRALACLLAALGLSACLYAEDWPMFRGARQDAAVPEADWDASLGGGRPKILWKRDVGPGYSSMAVVDGRLYTMGSNGDTHIVYCLDATSGKDVWTQRYKAARDIGGYHGPRATPTIANGKVYTVGNQGQIHCFAAKDGKQIWVRDEAALRRLMSTKWGASGSVLIAEGLAIVNAGDHGMALDADTGETRWASTSGTAGYATPVLCLDGRGAAIFSAQGLAIVRIANGQFSSIYPWQTRHDVNAADPLFYQGHVLISSNYGKGSALLRFAGGRYQEVWKNDKLRSWFPTPVLVGDRVVGNDQGRLVCLDIMTGREVWRGPSMGIGGTITLIDDKLVVLAESGELTVADAPADRYVPAASVRLGGGQWWTSPVFVEGLLFVRSSRPGELSCLDLRTGQ